MSPIKSLGNSRVQYNYKLGSFVFKVPPKVYVDDVFNTYLYEASAKTRIIENGIDLSGQDGLVWSKSRSNSENNVLIDTVRGGTKLLYSNSTNSESEASAPITFSSTGYSISGNGAGNSDTFTYSSWTFRKAPGFFDIVTYTGNDTAGRQIAHSLGSTPGMIIVKNLTKDWGWNVYHRGIASDAETDYLLLNSTAGASDDDGRWNDTAPTSSVFTVGTGQNINGSGSNYVAYLFAHDDQRFGTNRDESIIKCGSFTTNNSSEATINLGFEPQWLLYKRTDGGTENWQMLDVMRGWTVNTSGAEELKANDPAIEGANNGIKPFSNGFYLDAGHSNDATYVYVAIRRPHKPPSSGTDVLSIDTRSVASANTPSYISNFPVDLAIRKTVDSSSGHTEFISRLTSRASLFTDTTDDSATNYADGLDYNNGWLTSASSDADAYSWMFRRFPGFFDVVTYKGNAVSGREINHNLGVAPELIMTKKRNIGTATGFWRIYAEPIFGVDGFDIFRADDSNANSNNSVYGSTAPTATSFFVGSGGSINEDGDEHVAFLFASLNGISKIGKYDGTGQAVNVDCGFTSGARFVLIKRADDTGHWILWDKVRGINSADEPYSQLSALGVQSTGNDYIDPLDEGFTITSSAPTEINENGGTYIFLAIA